MPGYRVANAKDWNPRHRRGLEENDNEAKGEANQQDYGMRIYDPRVAKFLSVDPLTKTFSMLTPYQYASNSPIQSIDLDGEEGVQVTIRPIASDPALKQVNVQKIVSEIRQPTLSVTYIIYKVDGLVGSTYTTTGFVPGSVEAQLVSGTDINGNNRLLSMSAGYKDANGRFQQQGTQTDESCALVDAKGKGTDGLNGFQYDLNIQFRTDGAKIDNADLAPTTPLANVNTQIANARTTLTNPNLSIVGANQQPTTTNMNLYSVKVIGETDARPSNYVPPVPNGKANGNPALAQERANNLVKALNFSSTRNVTTGINNHTTGGANQGNRNSHINITPP